MKYEVGKDVMNQKLRRGEHERAKKKMRAIQVKFTVEEKEMLWSIADELGEKLQNFIRRITIKGAKAEKGEN